MRPRIFILLIGTVAALNLTFTLLNLSWSKAKVKIWTHKMIETQKNKCLKGRLEGGGSVSETKALFDGLRRAPKLKGGRVLVLGSKRPWVEACALAAGAKSVVALEYDQINSQHPDITTVTPDEFKKQYFANTLGIFDSIVTFSFVERVEGSSDRSIRSKVSTRRKYIVERQTLLLLCPQIGLERHYGDALNPWGDVLEIARARCVIKPGGSLVIGGVYGTDKRIYRMYGSKRWPYLSTNWTHHSSGKGSPKVHVFVNDPEKSHTTNICKKAVCIKTTPDGGLGHKLINLLQSKMMSLALKIPMATPNLERGRRKGEKYTGLNDIFPLSEHIVDCSQRNLGWSVKSLRVTGSVFNVHSKQLKTLRTRVNKAACNTVFTVGEFWLREYEATFPWLRKIFAIGMQSPTAKNITKNLTYNTSRFNIAVHFRNGDITPTPPAHFQTVIRQILSDLKPLTTLPIDITIFSENFAELPNRLQKIANASGLNVRIKTNNESSAVATMIYFTRSDIFVASDSSMGWIPTWIAGNSSNPVVIAAPSTRSAQTWTTGTLRTDINGTYSDRNKIISKANSIAINSRIKGPQ